MIKFRTRSLYSILVLFLIMQMIGCDNDQGHSHTAVNQETIKLNARLIVIDHVAKNKLDNSWASIEASSAVKEKSTTNPKWKVIFINKNIANTNKRKYYVYLTLDGKFIAANFTEK